MERSVILYILSLQNMKCRPILYLFLMFSVISGFSQKNKTLNPDVEKVNTLLINHRYLLAINLINKNIETTEKEKKPEQHSWFLCEKGTAYLDTLNADSAKVYFEKALKEALTVNCKKNISYSLFGIGKFYYRNSSYKEAIKYFQLLNHYSLNEKDTYYQFRSNYYLGASYYFLKSYNLSIIYNKKAAGLALVAKDTSAYINSILAIGNQFEMLHEVDSTNYYHSMANTIYYKWSNKDLSAGSSINNSLLKTQILKRDFRKGIYYGKLAINNALEDNNFTNLNVYYDNIAICYTELKMYDSAFFYYDKALEIELNYNYVDEYKEDLKELIYISKITHNTKKAFFYVDKYVNADSLYQRPNSEIIDSLRHNFELEKNRITLKAEEEKLQEVYKKKQIIYLSVGAILLLAITIVSYLFYLRKQFSREKEKQNLLLKVKDSEIQALQSQMNPHFIFNSLNSVLEFISNADTASAVKYLTKFSRLIRLVLEFSRRKNILLFDEIELLTLYIELENIKSETGFNYTFSIDENLDLKNDEIPSMLIQPFVENSIIHGIQNKMRIAEQKKSVYKGELTISFIKQGSFLKCIIADNGVGREKALEIKNNKLLNHLSLGMRITEDRLNLFSKAHCKIEYFDLKDENNNPIGTKAEILIPLIEIF